MIEVLNLGAGVQSTTVLLMSVHGELPKLDHAIFADTGWEQQVTYDHLAWLKPIAERAGITVHHLEPSDIRGDAIRSTTKEGSRAASLPYFLDSGSEKEGRMRRQCTYEYKVVPIERCIKRKILGQRKRQRTAPKSVRQWFGISFDELHRMKTSQNRWTEFWYPLVELRMSRNGCLDWLDKHGYNEPPPSSCVGCPFHSNQEWRRLKANPEEWADAVAFDRQIRKSDQRRATAYLHRQLVPLEQVDLRTDLDKGQMHLWQDECEGMCGI